MKVHFIAIGGSAMHNLAIALHQKGYKVTGSDDVIFEPSSSRLAKYGLLPEQMGWEIANIAPDLDAVILGMHARADNPELLKAQEMGLKIYSYPEYIYEQAKNKLRVVIGGSHGKTTITSMILHVLKFYEKEFDYLVGAQLAGFETMVKVTETAPIMIIEGDEYLASPIDRRPKFHLYHANIAVISGIAWDHINVFPTFGDYISQFDKFIYTISPKGKLIYCESDPELKQIVENTTADIKKIPYTIPRHKVVEGNTILLPNTPLNIFGNHNLMNLNVARLVCEQLRINEGQFRLAIRSFTGAAKRLELLNSIDNTNVYKDFAHSPSKLKATIDAVKSQFEDRKLVACMELHTFSSLNSAFLAQYKNTMDNADIRIVYVDEKTFLHKKMEPLTRAVIEDAFNDKDLLFFNDSSALESYLRSLNFEHTNLLLMSSGNFGGMDLVKLAYELNSISSINLKPKNRMSIIGKNIRQLRQKNSWSQGEVAKRLEISIPAFSKIETGITDINFSRLDQIANLFEVSTIDLISKDGEHHHSENAAEINMLKEKLAFKEEEIINLQKKVIDLYEEMRNITKKG